MVVLGKVGYKPFCRFCYFLCFLSLTNYEPYYSNLVVYFIGCTYIILFINKEMPAKKIVV